MGFSFHHGVRMLAGTYAAGLLAVGDVKVENGASCARRLVVGAGNVAGTKLGVRLLAPL
jgi:hypothetical protein